MQIKRGYAEGGFLDDGAVVDGVSGNEVPTGSLDSEVRDDIPAQLSEGEFVLPADVVRFIGLDKLMKMRKAAKIGLASMEEEGQIGGAPAPAMHVEMESMGMDDESMEMDALIDGMDGEGFEGAAQNFAQGGSVRGYESGGAAKLPSYADYTGKGKDFGELNAVEYVKYTNAAGELIDVGVLRGKPLRPVPEGFYPVEVKPEDPDAVDPDVPVVDPGGSRAVMHKNDPNNPWKGITAPGDSDTIKLHHQLGSDKITKSRMSTLDALVGATVDNEDQVAMYNMLSEDAKKLFSDRFSDPQGLDGILTKGKTPAELMVLAQKTADTVRRNGKLPDPSYTGQPSGETPSIENFLKGIIPDVGKVKDMLKNVILAGVGISPGVFKIFEKLVSPEDATEVQKLVVEAGGFVQDPAVPPNPFTDTTTDTTTEEAVGKGATIVGNPITGEGPTNRHTASPIQGQGPRNQYKEWQPEVKRPAIAQEVNSQDDKLLGEMGVGADSGGTVPYAARFDEQDKAVSVAKMGEIGITSEDSIPEYVYPDRTAEMGLLGSTANTDEYGNKTDGSEDPPPRKTPAQIREEMEQDNTLWSDEWAQFVEEQNIRGKPTEGKRKEAMIRETEKWGEDAKAYAAKREADRLASQSKGGGNTKQDRETAKRAMAKAKAKNVADAAKKGEHYVGGQYGLASGGLAGKKKPVVKKMRKDSTSGLAAKKKSKERAKAKKGALAAKRT